MSHSYFKIEYIYIVRYIVTKIQIDTKKESPKSKTHILCIGKQISDHNYILQEKLKESIVLVLPNGQHKNTIDFIMCNQLQMFDDIETQGTIYTEINLDFIFAILKIRLIFHGSRLTGIESF